MTTRKSKTTAPARIEALLAGIAQGRLGIETLERRGLDRHDFREVYVPQLRRALLQAYTQGYQDGARARGAGLDALVAMLNAGERRVSAAPESALGPAADSAEKSQNSGPASGFPAKSSELM
ncbi:MAG: hypothetical protein LC121_21650 [Anaerolineae bacterium]|nr:hypothetical protein [Anaerolineae bacterium]